MPVADVVEQLSPWVGALIQTAVLLVGLGIAFGVLRADIKGHGGRLDDVEDKLEKMQDVMVLLARQEERYNAMDARVLAQGQRLDSTASQLGSRIDTSLNIVNGRLEAINNIVSGHTGQINSLLSRRGPHPP